jgi:ABC-type glycerol-3-phosphate transport system permease component
VLQVGITVATVPYIAVYLLLQRYFVAGFLAGAVK